MTIKEVARIAGVSSAAVSRYFNGGPLSPAKRTAIGKAILQTGYRPDSIAQMLRKKVTDHIGVIVPQIDSDAVGRMTAGITQVLSERGYLCLLANTGLDASKELDYLDLFQARPVAGILLMATVFTPQLENMLRTCTLPVTVVGQRFPGVSCVYHDDFHAACEVTQRLLQRGRKSLVYIGVTEQDMAVGVDRKRGVQAALSDAGYSPEVPSLVSPFSEQGGYMAMETLLKSYPDLDGVICATDVLALGALERLKEAGRRVPADVSLAGLDDCWVDRFVTPKLTTVHFYYEACGAEAACLLLSGIGASKPPPVQQIMLGYTIVDRESV